MMTIALHIEAVPLRLPDRKSWWKEPKVEHVYVTLPKLCDHAKMTSPVGQILILREVTSQW